MTAKPWLDGVIWGITGCLEGFRGWKSDKWHHKTFVQPNYCRLINNFLIANLIKTKPLAQSRKLVQTCPVYFALGQPIGVNHVFGVTCHVPLSFISIFNLISINPSKLFWPVPRGNMKHIKLTAKKCFIWFASMWSKHMGDGFMLWSHRV